MVVLEVFEKKEKKRKEKKRKEKKRKERLRHWRNVQSNTNK